MKHLTRPLTLAAAVALAVPMVAATATSASAASRDGACNSGEFCYYYNSDNAGSISDFAGSVSDYGTTQPGCYDFKGAGNGQGQCIKNNAASVWNRSGKTVRVYYNTGYAGTYQDIAPGAKKNLNSTLKNNNASHKFLSTSTGGAQTPVNDYDGNARGFAQNNCTAFAAWRIASRLGRPNFNNYWKGVHWGDAGHWDDAARQVGITVNKTPKVGAIAVNDVHVSSSDGILHGHVAYVNKVYSDGTFDVEEYNWNTRLGYGRRTHMRVSSADTQFQWMLHF
jgi:surface antigen